jgi:hypothetical protein
VKSSKNPWVIHSDIWIDENGPCSTSDSSRYFHNNDRTNDCLELAAETTDGKWEAAEALPDCASGDKACACNDAEVLEAT